MTSPNVGAYNQATTTVTTAPTLIALCLGSGTGGILVQNNGSVPIFLGGSNVTSSGATQGVSVAGSATLYVPTVGGTANTLYAVTNSSTASVSVLFAAGA